jgi:uncharacterized protein
MQVQVVFADTQGMQQETLQLQAGSLLKDALAISAVAAHVLQTHAEITAGIWNRLRPLDTPLQEGDRIELYKPLVADPKDARRTRVELSREEALKKKAAARKVTAAKKQ